MMKQFRTFLIAAVALFGFQTMSAQTKVAHVDTNEIMTKMPAVLDAQNQLKKLSDTYTAEYKTMVDEYQAKIKKYEAEVVERKERDLQLAKRKIRKNRQNKANYAIFYDDFLFIFDSIRR